MYIHSTSKRFGKASQILLSVQVSDCGFYIRVEAQILPGNSDVADGILCPYCMSVEEGNSPAPTLQRPCIHLQGTNKPCVCEKLNVVLATRHDLAEAP